MSINNQLNEKISEVKSLLSQKVGKYSYHLKELLVHKSSHLNEKLIAHIPYFTTNYLSKVFQNPLYFVRINDDLKSYATLKFTESLDEFSSREKITMAKADRIRNSTTQIVVEYNLTLYLSAFLVFTSFLRRI